MSANEAKTDIIREIQGKNTEIQKSDSYISRIRIPDFGQALLRPVGDQKFSKNQQKYITSREQPTSAPYPRLNKLC